MDQKLDLILSRTNAIETNLHTKPSSLVSPARSAEELDFPSASLTITNLCWLHRILTVDVGISEAVRGRFRAVQVWVGPANSTKENASFVPTPPNEVPARVSKLLQWWHDRHNALRNAEKLDIIAGLAEFHHRFLVIHPFLDANGRVALCLIDQAARELLNEGISRELTADPSEYFSALNKADKGDLAPLTQRVLASLG